MARLSHRFCDSGHCGPYCTQWIVTTPACPGVLNGQLIGRTQSRFRTQGNHCSRATRLKSDEGSCNVIVGSGIDVIETGRLERELERSSWHAHQGIFTAAELHAIHKNKKPALLYAAIFAAKEAALKALSFPVLSLANFREVEIFPDPEGKWSLHLHGRCLDAGRKLGMKRAVVALASSKTLSGAMVVLEA